jgi:large subunit ribosomal protein L17
MLRNMVTSLLGHETVTTTDARAKALKSIADRMITLGKRGDLHAKRQALAVIRSKDVARRLFDDIAPRYTNRDGGYVRVLKKGVRQGDGAPLSVVELVEKAPRESRGKGAVEKARGFKDRIMGTLKSK